MCAFHERHSCRVNRPAARRWVACADHRRPAVHVRLSEEAGIQRCGPRRPAVGKLHRSCIGMGEPVATAGMENPVDLQYRALRGCSPARHHRGGDPPLRRGRRNLRPVHASGTEDVSAARWIAGDRRGGRGDGQRDGPEQWFDRCIPIGGSRALGAVRPHSGRDLRGGRSDRRLLHRHVLRRAHVPEAPGPAGHRGHRCRHGDGPGDPRCTAAGFRVVEPRYQLPELSRRRCSASADEPRRSSCAVESPAISPCTRTTRCRRSSATTTCRSRESSTWLRHAPSACSTIRW